VGEQVSALGRGYRREARRPTCGRTLAWRYGPCVPVALAHCAALEALALAATAVIAQQMDLLESMRQRDLGMELVLERYSDYRSKVRAAILWFAVDGQEFGADDVRVMVGDPPRGVSTNLVGALFNAASKAGVIRIVGYGTSARVVGHGNLTRRWVGVRSNG
jgi:hypothetical protein